MPFLEDDDDFYADDSGESRELRRTKFINFGNLKFYIIGVVAAVVVFCTVIFFIYNNNKPVDLGDLPIIKADPTPLKVKPEANEMIEHQDKIVYDNISGDTRVVQEKILPAPEEPKLLYDHDGMTLSSDEKENIIREFDELAPREDDASIIDPIVPQTPTYTIPSKPLSPPINNVEHQPHHVKKNKKSIREFIKKEQKNSFKREIKQSASENIMIQVASLTTKNAAEAEYKRLRYKNGVLRTTGHKITKVDLGAKGIRYRVQVGPFRSKIEAQNAIAKLRESGLSAYISR